MAARFLLIGLLLFSHPVLGQKAAVPISEMAAETESKLPELLPTSAFASRNSMFNAKLSPDGGKFALQKVADGRTLVMIFDAQTRERIQVLDIGKGGTMHWFRWAGSDKLLFSVRNYRQLLFFILPASKLMMHDLNTSETSFVGLEEQGFEGDDVLYVEPSGEFLLLSLSEKTFADPSVYKFLLDGSGEESSEMVQKRTRGISEWWADNQGVVRLGMKRNGRRKVSFFYRSRADEKLERIVKLRRDADDFDNWDVLSIRAGSDTGYALVKDDRGLDVLREFDYKTGLPGEVIYRNDQWGLEGALIEEDGILRGATFTSDFPETHWIDPEMAQLQDRLELALGGGVVRILSRAGMQRMLVWHGGANDPGVLYVFTPGENRLETFGEFRPDVDFKQLAEPRSIRYQARDGTEIPAYLTLPRGRDPKNLPLIILPHGGPYGIRDTLYYNDEVQLLANRGYAVLQPNYRGSGGYGKAYEDLGYGEIGRAMQDDLDDAMDWAVEQGYADPNRVCMVGGSYGGYASLWAVIRNPERYRCAASWAGVTDFETQLKFDRDFFDRRSSKRWERRIEGEERGFDLDDVSPAQQAHRLTRPVLLAHGKDDRTVPFGQYTAMREAAEKANVPLEKLEIEDEGHGFSKRSNEQKWYDTLTAFLAKHNPSDVNVPALHESNDSAKETSKKDRSEDSIDDSTIESDEMPEKREETVETQPNA